MNVTLREITSENFKECIDLKVADAQKTFVASNVASIAQSKVYPAMNPMAVYAETEMVGFVMSGFDADENRFYLVRLMIDERFQGRGCGKAATLAFIEKMRENPDCREIYLSFVPENTGAEALYKSLGFERTGEIDDGEIVMRYVMENNGQPATDN